LTRPKQSKSTLHDYPIYDATVYNILESLKAGTLIDEEEKVYRVKDPMLRTLLLTSQTT